MIDSVPSFEDCPARVPQLGAHVAGVPQFSETGFYGPYADACAKGVDELHRFWSEKAIVSMAWVLVFADGQTASFHVRHMTRELLAELSELEFRINRWVVESFEGR